MGGQEHKEKNRECGRGHGEKQTKQRVPKRSVDDRETKSMRRKLVL